MELSTAKTFKLVNSCVFFTFIFILTHLSAFSSNTDFSIISLFIGNLAFAQNNQYIDGVKIGVLTGSLLSTLVGYFLLLIFSKK